MSVGSFELEIYNIGNMDYIKKAWLPKFHIPIKGMTSDEYLAALVDRRATCRYGRIWPKGAIERISHELEVIEKYGLADYFLIWWEIIDEAKARGIMVGPGRSSAAGSIVNYCLGITNIDPLKYGLLFERFFNLNRSTSKPYIDIDVDFDWQGRDEIVDWVERKYGEHFAHISTYRHDEDGNVTSIGVHLCGIVLCRINLWWDNVVPTQEVEVGGVTYFCTENKERLVEEDGLMKLDFLQMKELSIIKDVLQKTNLRIEDIPLYDAKTMKMFQEGDTGKVLLFEGKTMRKNLRLLHPDSFLDLVLLYSMLRPGPMANIPMIIMEKESSIKREYSKCSCLVDILEETYGLIVYQEQVMRIAQVVAGFSPKESDRLYVKQLAKRKILI